MALTKEQIKGLKPGDPLVIHGEYIENHSDGDIVIKCNMTRGGVLATDGKYLHPSCVSLPPEKPKHDPCRLFKEGDRVRVVAWNGRHFHDRDHGTELTTGCICEVSDDEEAECEYGVLVIYEEQVRGIAPCYLELVTPVEELEPYKLIDSPNTYNIVRDSAMVMTIHKKSHPNAKAAAEAERDRLNAEWRKEEA